jgi:hypothetical protein
MISYNYSSIKDGYGTSLKNHTRSRTTTHTDTSPMPFRQIYIAQGKHTRKILLPIPKKKYKYIRRSLNNTKVSVPQLRNDDGSLCFDDNKTANIFAKYFAEVFSTDPHGYRVNSQPEVMLPQISTVIENIQFTEEKIKNCICSLINIITWARRYNNITIKKLCRLSVSAATTYHADIF